MEFDVFSRKIRAAAAILRDLCPADCGLLPEPVIKQAVTEVGLQVTFPEDGFVLDPVRMITYTLAYKVPFRKGVTEDKAIKTAWSWYEKRQQAA